ncbi:alpha/beta fold hydrolase [Flavobacteriaceae bacterium]|jgi:homoserine O-acetyltransferase|nr:alpha/beta fold hydrolase [Flavobacteriaceae bacterium]
MSEIQKISIAHFTTASGVLYESIDLYYEHFGQAVHQAPVVLINHSLTGDSNVAGDKGWWTSIVGSGKTIDTDAFAVIAFNIPGNGAADYCIKSYSDFHTGDIARIFYLGLQLLKIDKLYAVIGGSIGGGIAWEMAALYPQLADYVIPVAADWKATDWIIANTFLQERILKNSSQPLRDARIHAMLTYRTPQSFEYRFGRSKSEERGYYNVEGWLLHHGNKLVNRFHLDAYVMMNHLLASIDITRNGEDPKTLISSIASEIHLIAIDSDLFFTPDEDRKTYALVHPEKENIYYHELQSIHGHDAFLIENDSVSKILKKIFTL